MQICGHNASRVVSPITLAVVSEDGRGTSARIEIVEAARGVMQLAGRSGDVRLGGKAEDICSSGAFQLLTHLRHWPTNFAAYAQPALPLNVIASARLESVQVG